MYWDGHGGGGGWVLGMALMMILFWGAIVAVVVYAVHSLVPRHQPPDPQAAAKAVLAERLARGEIDADEYRERLTALTS